MRWAKLVPPMRPPGFVERPNLDALFAQLSAPRDRGRVILVSAPAGQGKTAAVADWVRNHPELPTAWASLDPGDRDEATWWDTVLTALAEATGADAGSPLRVGRFADPDPAHGDRHGVDRGSVASALNVLDELPSPVRLVLDDVHEIVGHPAFSGLLTLLRHPFPMLTLVLCSRFDPPLGLERLRLHHRLGQVRVAQLAFTRPEATLLFEHDDLGLTEQQVAILVERTEGWIAALRLAGLSLNESADRGAFVDRFAGDDRSVADYLVSEVFGTLDTQQRAVLEAASVCSLLPVELAAELSGFADAGDVLDRLETSTALVTATDRRRTLFRTHELLRSHVLARARRQAPVRLGELYRRACRWYEGQGDHVQALRCAAAAGDVATVALLLRSRAIELLARGEFRALADSELDLAEAADDPRVRLVLGLAAFERGEVDHGEQLVESAEHELAAHPAEHQSDNLIAFRRVVATRVAFVRGRVAPAVAVGLTIDPDAVEGPSLRALSLSTRATALLATDRHRARRDAEEALAVALQHDWPYLAIQAQSTAALSDCHAGHGARLRGHALAVIDQAAAHGWTPTIWTLRARFALATADVLSAKPDEALVHIEQATSHGHAHLGAALTVLRGAVEHDQGRPLVGWQRIRRIRVTGGDQSRERHTTAFAAVLEQQAALAAGRTRDAAEVTRAMSDFLQGSAELALLRARDRWAAGDHRARDELEPALCGRVRALSSLAAVEVPLLDAEIALSRGELLTVHHRVLRALELARRFDVVRPWRQIREPLRRYVAEHRGSFGDLDDLVDEVMASPYDPPLSDPLTEREREILEMLPTMRSAAEIAADLTVSVNTVKTHQRAIYRKLRVDNRRQAVTRAREAGLLASIVS